jgi:hypothetical protein
MGGLEADKHVFGLSGPPRDGVHNPRVACMTQQLA